MQIVALSDLHGDLPATLPEGDVLVFAGDICPDYGIPQIQAQEAREQRRWLIYEFMPWLEQQPKYKRIIAVWGNHDWVGELYPRLKLQNDLAASYSSFDGPRVEFYEDELVDVEGYKFWCTPWSNQFYDWAFMKSPEELVGVYSKIPAGVDVIVSHQPPKHPQMQPVGSSGFFTPKLGSSHLGRVVLAVQPKVVICGHIHEMYGQYRLNDTRVYNVSINTGNMLPTNPVTIIEVE